MGSLSNLYISQSYTSLAHLGTNNALVPGTMTVLQDGLGQSLNISFDGTNISSSGNIFAANITGSQINTGSFVTTSSFNAYTSSTNNRLNNLENTSASVNVSISNLNSTTQSLNTSITNLNTTTASLNISVTNLNASSASQQISINSLNTNSASVNTSITNLNSATSSLFGSASLSLVTASVSGQTLTFTKGNNSTFSVTLPTGSGGGTTNTGSLMVTGSVNVNVLTFTKGDGSTFDLTVAASGSAPAGTISGSAQITALGFVSSSVTASSLVTASVSGAIMTFTKGDASTFNVTLPTGGGTIDTGSFAITGSNTFVGDQTINAKLIVSGSSNSYIQFSSPNSATGSGAIFFGNNGSYIQTYNAGSNPDNQGLQLVAGLSGSFALATRYGGAQGEVDLHAQVEQGVSNEQSRLRIIAGNGIAGTSSGQISLSGSATLLQNLRYPTADGTNGQVLTTNGSGVLTFTTVSGGGTTYINPTLNPYSGSLILVANTFTSSSFSYISASANGQVNLVFKNNNNTPDTILSGSNNIFVNPGAATAGFKRYIGGSNNILTLVPQLTGSAGFSPSMNSNISSTGMLMRLPVSSSAYTMNGNLLLNPAANGIQLGTAAATHFERAVSGLTFNNNIVNGNLTAVASKTPLSASVNISQNNIGGTLALNMDSSSITMATSIVQGQLTVNNSYLPNTVTAQSAQLSIQSLNNVGANFIFASGSNTTFTGPPRGITASSMLGGFNVLSASLNGDNAQINATHLIGQGLTAVGTNSRPLALSGADWGSVFVGRWNSLDGTKDLTAETIFAVGTGTAEGSRKTGFLIDSGSNTFVEGTLNVSGSTSLTGSLTIQSGSSFFANGNRQFNVGAFQSDITQSGSANVSQSMNFETTDISSGVSIASNSRITLANSGTYNIQFSAQIDRVSGSGTDTVHIWLKKNGTNVDKSAGAITISGGAAAAKTIAAWNYVVNAAASDYYELCWESTDNRIQLINQPATGNIPSTPSIILTVTQVR